mmetsp:Transcript_129766/g.193183  ORF Transcript_129766/g.193183 Transcript_129766/m.193183 type:complete len:122 (-) Transcript_129766:117-482(-)
MGCNQSTPETTTAKPTTVAPPEAHRSNNNNNMSETIEVALKKHRPGCTGMFWRPDPTGATPLKSNSNWPRDGARLRGTVVEAKGKKWLLATEVLQNGKTEWVPAPPGAAMPFEYDNHYSLE